MQYRIAGATEIRAGVSFPPLVHDAEQGAFHFGDEAGERIAGERVVGRA